MHESSSNTASGLARCIFLVAAILFLLVEWRALGFLTVLEALIRREPSSFSGVLLWWDLAVIAGGPVAHLVLLRWRAVSAAFLVVAYRAAWVILLAILSRGLFDPAPLSEISFLYWLLLVVEGALLVASIALLQLRWHGAADYGVSGATARYSSLSTMKYIVGRTTKDPERRRG
ncbi:MAG: hypothetical protein H6648_00750 [Caldilineae bacterium]|nr:hypothetical protein [Caldilineae bacterium]